MRLFTSRERTTGQPMCLICPAVCPPGRRLPTSRGTSRKLSNCTWKVCARTASLFLSRPPKSARWPSPREAEAKPMRVIYDPAADALYIRMAAAKVNHSDQALDDAGVIFDFNAVAGLH